MIRILPVVLCIFFFSFYADAQQCTPNTSITQPGIYPDSATGLPSGVVNDPYMQDLQLRVPADTTVEIIPGFPTTVPITSVQLNSLTGLPAGLTYTCNPANCTFPGGSNGCVLISGTPTVAGIYPLTAIVTTTATFIGQPILQTDTLTYYIITVNSSSVGMDEMNAAAFNVKQNSPNPFTEYSDILFTSPFKTQVEFKMFNMIGKEVFRTLIDANAGNNDFRIEGRDFSPGVYMYSMTLGDKTVTQRMVISRK